MKHVLLQFTLLIGIVPALLAQAPLVKMWDKRFGGTEEETLRVLIQTNDGGFLLGGSSFSDSSGDKTQSLQGEVGNDYWIVKIDSLGNKQWDKRFGGDFTEGLTSLQQTSDKGYILGGGSASGISGDKTQPLQGDGGGDFWVVKIDSLGNKQWDKRFGGNMSCGTGSLCWDFDQATSLQQTHDRGYILGGISSAGIGGDKTQPNWDSTETTEDGWIVKIDELGNKQWDKRFGGDKVDRITSLVETNDKGYLLGGYSVSGISGDITQPSRGGADYWIVKTDSLGNKLWDKRFGGSNWDLLYSLQQTSDKGYILGGYTVSDSSGDVTQPPRRDSVFGGDTYDYWIVKIDSSGNKQWDRRFGGTRGEDAFGNISITSDGGYLLAGASRSNAGADKSENNLGSKQPWIVKLDSTGNLQWDKTVFTLQAGTPFPEMAYAIETNDGGYAIANYTNSGIAGYKTQSNWDPDTTGFVPRDYWIIKFLDTTNLVTPLSSVCSSSDVTCAGESNGSVGVNVWGGSAPYQYQWSTGDTTAVVSHLLAGNYIVTVTDFTGASLIDTVIIHEVAGALVLFSSSTAVLCNGENNGTAQLTVSGGASPYSYLWSFGDNSTSVTELSAGIYTVTVTDAYSCPMIDTIAITQPSELNVVVTSVTNHVTCIGASDGAAKAVASGGTPPYTFLWSDGQVTDAPTDLPAGAHSVNVTDTNGCTAFTSISIAEGPQPCVGIEEHSLNSISLHPNPTNNTLTISATINEQAILTLFDALGKVVWQQSAQPQTLSTGITLNMQEINEGVYFLSVLTTKGSRVVKVVRY